MINLKNCLFLILFITSAAVTAQVIQEDKFSIYKQSYRPQFHFSPPAHWMNDPNGMFFYEGEYHLFYQFYPGGNVWGPMHWGHAISSDLLHWQHLPIALYPDSLGYIFSGSAIVDWNNTSGFGINGQPPLVAIFTYHHMEGEKAGKTDFQNQGIAYSNDKGRSWLKYSGNPVVLNPGIKDFRDPKVFWHAGAGKWIMTLAAHDQVQFWASPNLKNWLPLSSFGKEWGTHAGVWECPDLFQLKVENSNEMKWVLLVSINPGGPNGGSATQYFVGEFDGTSFLPDKSYEVLKNKEQAVWLDYGRDNYAGVTWSDIPQNDGRRIFMGWMSNWDYATNVPTTEWRSAMTLPRKLILKNTSPGYRILANPVKEIEKLRKDSASFLKKTFIGSFDINGKKILNPAGVEILLDFEKPVSGKSYIELSNTKGERYAIGYNATENYFFSDRTQVGDISFSEKFASAIHTALRFDTANHVRMHLFFDATSMELFADDGKECMTEIYFPVKEFTFIKLFSEEVIKDVKVMMWNMKSTWSNQQDRNH